MKYIVAYCEKSEKAFSTEQINNIVIDIDLEDMTYYSIVDNIKKKIESYNSDNYVIISISNLGIESDE